MRFKPYPGYKDSGVDWLGDIPDHWELKKLKYLCSIQTGDKDTVNANEDGKYPFFVRSQTVEKINSFTFDCEAVLTAGDGVGVGKVFHYINGKFDFHQRVYAMYNFRRVSGKYFFYYLREMFHKVALDGSAKSTVDSLRLPMFLNFPFIISHIDEQTKIVNYLDRETQRIDALIEEKSRFIELLKEKRLALISHAVTKGLDPTVKMKDSGVEWLGEVPEHWKVTPLKHQCLLLKDGTHLPPPRVDAGIPLLSVRNIDDGRFFFRDDDSMISEENYQILCKAFVPVQNDVLLAVVGATLGKTALVPLDFGRFHIQRSVAIFRPKVDMESKWLNFIFQSQRFQQLLWEYAGYSAQPGIYLGTLANFRIPLAPKNEQLRIIDLIEKETAKIESLFQETQTSIELLKEHRTALINGAVTGKIDVREFAN